MRQKPTPPVSTREMFRITLCLALTCLVAGLVLGGVYFFTEPAKRQFQALREAKLVREMLSLDETAKVMEVRRYLEEGGRPQMGYLLSDGLYLYDFNGIPKKYFLKPSDLKSASAEDLNQWVETIFQNSHFVGRFFVASDHNGKVKGFVTETSQYGFKSHIRFFIALNGNFEIQGVEILSHEEDPGLGAEITKHEFKNQFLGRNLEQIGKMIVTKDPKPEEIKNPKEAPIYAVTGATLSSRALTEGVRKGVKQLYYRLGIVGLKGGLDE